MFRFLPYVLKTLWRHRTRTLLTISGTAVALLVFSFVTAVQEGLSRLLNDRQQDRTLIVFQANRFCPSTSKLPEDYARRVQPWNCAAVPEHSPEGKVLGVHDVTGGEVVASPLVMSLVRATVAAIEAELARVAPTPAPPT